MGLEARSVSGWILLLVAGMVGAEEPAAGGATADAVRFRTADHGAPDPRVPVIRPWRTVVLDPEYGGHWVVTGDVDGDGTADVVSAENVDENDVHYTSSVAAQRLDGSVLWRWGDPHAGRKKWHHDVACQIHDWNGDGRAEVVVGTRGFLVELDGVSGRERRRIAMPPDATDCIVFADLSGNGRASDVLVKTRYSQVWAYDRAGTLLWTVERPGGARTAHQPRPVDLDGDGRDEVLAGYALLDSDGTTEWTYASRVVDERRGHLDCARVLSRGRTPADWRFVLTCCGAENIACVDGTGGVVWELPGHHFESVQVGEVFPDLEGPEILVDIDHRPRGESPLWVLDARGALCGEIVTDYARHHALIDWTGDGAEEILLADAHGVFDQKGQRIATFGSGKKGVSLLLGDMTGDGTSDVAIVTASPPVVHIFRNERGKPKGGAARLGCGVNFTLY